MKKIRINLSPCKLKLRPRIFTMENGLAIVSTVEMAEI